MIAAAHCGLMVATLMMTADAGGKKDDADFRPIVSFGGGISRGAYEAGMAYGVLQDMRRWNKKGPLKKAQLAGTAGSSIGNLNALLTLLDWCREDKGPDESPFWQIWRGADWDALFPGDATCEDYAKANPASSGVCTKGSPFSPGDALFSSNGLEVLKQRILSLMEIKTGWNAACSQAIPIAMQLVSEEPTEVRLGSVFPVETSRRYFPAQFSLVRARQTDDDGSKASEDRWQPIVTESPAPAADLSHPNRGFKRLDLPFLQTAADKSSIISPRALLDVMAASVSQPPLMLTPAMAYCGDDCLPVEAPGLQCPEGEHVCRQRFFDAGTFDHVPLAGARLLSKDFGEHVVIDPALQSHPDPAKNFEEAGRGSTLYGNLITNIAGVASDYELQIMSRYRCEADVEANQSYLEGKPVYRVPRRTYIIGDLTAGFAGYFDERFRRYDYYAGIYDGIVWRLTREIDPKLDKESANRVLAASLVKNYGCQLLDYGGKDDDGHERICKDDERFPAALVYIALRSFGQHLCGGLRSAPECLPIRNRMEALVNDKSAQEMQTIGRALEVAVAKGIEQQYCPAPSKQQRRSTAPSVTKGRPIVPEPKAELSQRCANFRDLWLTSGVSSEDPGGKAQAFDEAVRTFHTGNDTFDKMGTIFAEELRAHGFDDGGHPYIASHEHWRYDTVRKGTARLADLELAQGNKLLAGGIGFVEYSAAVSASLRAPGWQLASATIPDRVFSGGLLAGLEKFVLPYTAAADLRNGGGRLVWELGAYRFSSFPRVRFPTFGVTSHWFRYAEGTDRGTSWGPTVGADCRFDSKVFSMLGLRAWYHPFGEDGKLESLGGEVFSRLFWGRTELSTGLRRFGGASDRGLGFFVTFGLADVNGLLYWGLRGITGDDVVYEKIVSTASGAIAVP